MKQAARKRKRNVLDSILFSLGNETIKGGNDGGRKGSPYGVPYGVTASGREEKILATRRSPRRLSSLSSVADDVVVIEVIVAIFNSIFVLPRTG